MSLLVLDVETTGIEPQADALVEIGGVVADSVDELLGGNSRRTLGWLIDPQRPIPAAASAIHHLTERDVIGRENRDDVVARLPRADFYVAHNARFEQAFLPELAPWICTFKVSCRVWRDAPGHALQVLRYWRGHYDVPGLEKDAPMHRALPDALVCAAIFCDLTRHVSVEQMHAWSQEPALLPCFTFGKHAMKPLEQVDTGYLQWMLSQDFGEDEAFTARNELQRRGRPS